MPEISVILSTYKRKTLLPRAISSVLSQTFKDYELIILDDGSTDGSAEIIKHYYNKNSNVKYIRFNENSGRPAIRYNQGIVLSSGKYLAFMFDDDFWYPHALETLHTFFEKNKECGMVYGTIKFIDTRTGNCKEDNFGGDWDLEKLKKNGNYLANISVLVRKDIIDIVGGYDESAMLTRCCDWDLWIRIGENFPVKKIDNKIGEVWGFYSDSVGITVPVDVPRIMKYQENKNRYVPLKKL